MFPDESQLAVETIQLAPFELIGGTHPSDLRSGFRRFFQSEYRLRLVDANAIGKDVGLPPVVIHYRVESLVQSQSSEGRDLTYVMPPLTIRVLSTVTADAVDIRDGSEEPFGAIEGAAISRTGARHRRARARRLRRPGARPRADPRILRRPETHDGVPVHVSDRSVLQGVAAELHAVRDASRGGWSPDLVARALTAVRIAAGYALGRRVAQRIIVPNGEIPEARLVIEQGVLRKRTAAVTSAVTTADVERVLEGRTAAAGGREAGARGLRSSLAALTHAQYAAAPGEARLDDDLGAVLDVVARLRREHGWLRQLG